jgi:hypothetical protein
VLAGDVHREPISTIAALHHGDQLVDRIVGRTRKHDGHDRRVPVARHEWPAARSEVAADGANGAGATDLGDEALDAGTEGRIRYPSPIGADDHDLVNLGPTG